MTIAVTELANGLRVVTDRIDAVETASVGVWAGVGTRDEAADQNGVSHLLEHMAFKGTARRSATDIAFEIEAVGGHLNAYTSREHTAYYARVLGEDVPLALDILADILQASAFDETELDRERAVILQEIGQCADQPEDLVFDAFQAAAYPNQPLGRTVLGTPEVVRSIPRDAIVDYMASRYRAGGMVVAASGRVEHEAFVARVSQAFGGLAPGRAPAAEVGIYVGGDARDERKFEQVHLVMGFDGISYLDPDYYAAQVFSTLYGGGMSSRLFQEVREKRGLVYSIYSFASGHVDGGLFGVYAGTGTEEIGDVIDIVCDEFRDVAASARDDEVARARAQLKAHTLMARESTSARCEQAAQQLLIFGRPLTAAEIVAEIEAVDAAAVRRVAERIARSPLTFTAVGPVAGIAPYERIAARLR